MDFRFSQEDEAFRVDFRKWLKVESAAGHTSRGFLGGVFRWRGQRGIRAPTRVA